MEIHRVPFVERVNLAASRNFDLEKKGHGIVDLFTTAGSIGLRTFG